MTDELFDLSTMAMEYFKENIEPSLPEITYFGSDFLEFTPPFATPSKRLSSTIGFDSPMSSRASAVGSSCSEPPLPYNTRKLEKNKNRVWEGSLLKIPSTTLPHTNVHKMSIDWCHSVGYNNH